MTMDSKIKNAAMIQEIKRIIDSEIAPEPDNEAVAKARIIYDEIVEPVILGMHASGSEVIKKLKAEVEELRKLKHGLDFGDHEPKECLERYLADIRGFILGELGSGTPLYEKWLGPTVSTAGEIKGLVQEYVATIKADNARLTQALLECKEVEELLNDGADISSSVGGIVDQALAAKGGGK